MDLRNDMFIFVCQLPCVELPLVFSFCSLYACLTRLRSVQVDPGGKHTPNEWNCTVSYETRQLKKIYLKLRD